MSEIADFAASTSGFYQKSAVDQLLILAWFIEAREQRPRFDGVYMRQCFRDVGLDAPEMSVYLPRLAAKRPPQLVREKGGYRLSSSTRRELDKRLGADPTMVAIDQTLSSLPGKIPDLAERAFLTETINCYRVKAYRATVVMVWNLAYDHLVRWITKDGGRLDALNLVLASKYSKKSIVLRALEDFN